MATGNVMRLVCGACDRNIARVRHDESNPDFTRDSLVVEGRPTVDQEDYRPWEAAQLPEGTPGRDDGVDYDIYTRTYTWRCRCGAVHVRRHEWVGREWLRLTNDSDGDAAWRVVLVP